MASGVFQVKPETTTKRFTDNNRSKYNEHREDQNLDQLDPIVPAMRSSAIAVPYRSYPENTNLDRAEIITIRDPSAPKCLHKKVGI